MSSLTMKGHVELGIIVELETGDLAAIGRFVGWTFTRPWRDRCFCVVSEQDRTVFKVVPPFPGSWTTVVNEIKNYLEANG